jgi:hypothetical protein
MDCFDKTCVAVQDNGRVLVWGEYEPITQLRSDTPREVEGLDGVSKAQAGSRFFLALKRTTSRAPWATGPPRAAGSRWR